MTGSSGAAGASRPAGPATDEGARAPRADARLNRERVLGAAREAFADDGLAVPLDEIARRAGVGAGTVYRHFPTKGALFEAVVFGRLRDLVRDARTLASSEDPGGAFFGFLSRMVEEGVAKRDLTDALAGAGIDLDLGGSRIARELGDAVGELLGRAQRGGAVREDVDTADVMALLSGVTLAIRHHGRGPDATDRMVALVSDGLRPPR